MTAQEVRLHLRYSGWASRKLLEAAQKLAPEESSRGMSVSHGSILGTLAHIHFADRIWYSRTVDPSTALPPVIKAPTLESLAVEWAELQKKWEAWSESLTDADLERVASYKFTDGREGQNQVSQIILHLVNHATLHRGQVVAMLRQLGQKPPATDFIFYVRELATAAKAS